MSTNRYDFWTHGVTTIVANPERADEIIRSPKESLTVRQSGGEGWFAIPITRPTGIAGDSAELNSVRMRYLLDKAYIVRVEFRRGGQPIEAFTWPTADEPPLTGGVNKVILCKEKARYRRASIMFWVLVKFDDAGGKIVFHDTGAVYFTQQISLQPRIGEVPDEELEL